MANLIKKTEFEPIESDFVSQSGLTKDVFYKEVSFAIQHLQNNTYLQGATRDSILKSVLNIAQVGLTLNPIAKYAYLMPKKIKGQLVCVLEPSYMGLCKLLTDTGSVRNVYSNIVRQKDTFQIDLGINQIEHKPDVFEKDRGEVIGVYAVAILSDGSKQIEFMSVDEINEIRATSESYKAYGRNLKEKNKKIPCTWVSHWNEMARKTVIKRLYKYVPKSDKHYAIQQAIELDNQVNGFNLMANNNKIDVIYSLIRTSSLDENALVEIESNINENLTDEMADKLIKRLNENQREGIKSGDNYSQGDILKKLE